MKLLVLGLLIVGALSVGKFPTPDYYTTSHIDTFKAWKTHFGRVYPSVDIEMQKFRTFLKVWKSIDDWNKNPKDTYTQGINQFTDMTPEEFKLYIHGHKGSCLLPGQKTINKFPKPKVKVPSSVDWTTKGVVTPVKNQGQCGSCWAFSTTGSVESRSAIKTGVLTSLSEQQLVDCAGSYGNQGCNGGLMTSAFQYIESVGGLCSESEYPYQGVNGQCQASSCGTKYDPVQSYGNVQEGTMSMEEAIVAGPVSIGVEADQPAFQSYSGGVASGYCGTSIDHGVLAVGYGSLDGQDYWKVKNSWGASWGLNGYILLCRNCNKNGGAGECGILSAASYPIV